MKQKWNDFKALLASFVVWAETNLAGKTGAEKKAAVVEMLCDKFPWPVPLRWIQRPILKVVVGGLIDRLVATLNSITGHDFAGVVVDPAEIVEASEIPRSALAKAQDIDAETVDERIQALLAQYQITGEVHPVQVEPEYIGMPTIVEPVPKSYFTRSEFTCKCGCGTNKVQQDLIDMLNVIREAFGKAVTVTSGTRCVAHNAKIGGATNSNHITGHAADIRCTDRSMTPAEMYDVVMRLYREGKIPQLAGISKNYGTIIHVDVHPKRADGQLRTW